MFGDSWRKERGWLGLDIGTAAIKAVVLERRHGRIALRRAAVGATPPDALTEGVLTDGIAVSRALDRLLTDHRIVTRRAAAALGGDRVFCQIEDSPASDDDAADEEFVRSRAEKLLPYALDAACLGAQRVDSVVEGAVLWTAAPVEFVDWTRETVSLAGRNAKLIASQAAALANAFAYSARPSSREAVLLVHIGVRRLVVVAMRGWVAALSRDMAFARGRATTEDERGERVLDALEPLWGALRQSVRPYDFERIVVSGGGASASAVEALRRGSGMSVETLDPLHRLAYSPAAPEGQVAAAHAPALGVAIGMALTGIERE